ncbi:hypothetical protein KAJ27_21015 [bacterium]|nr:hypothetical protein [bacterium]
MIDSASEKIKILLQGKIPDLIDIEKIDDESKKKCAEQLNKLFDFMKETRDFILPLSRGELTDLKVSSNNFLGSPFKELHSRLLHLTWQAKQVANGDFNQRVDFMGEFSEAFNSMIISLDNNEKVLKNKIAELEDAMDRIKTLEGILPICSSCKKIRNKDSNPGEQSNWVQMESYISDKTDAEFSHSICPECMKRLYPDLADKISNKKSKI